MLEMFPRWGALLAFAFAISNAMPSRCETFTFGGFVGGMLRNGLDGGEEDTHFQITEGAFTLSIEAGPTGARLSETASGSGLGIAGAHARDGAIDVLPNSINVLQGALDGVSEFFRFSFSRAGILTGINFDGISDDSLEFFVMESPGKVPVYFFDLDANHTVPGAVDEAIRQGVVRGHVVYLLDDPPGTPDDLNDEIYNLRIPFSAGQVFTMTYGALTGLGAPYEPVETPRDARFQQFVVQAVPEPAGWLLLVIAGVLVDRRARQSWQG